MSSLPALPRVPRTADSARRGFDDAVKETLEVLTGRRTGRIGLLPADASTSDIIAKVNELIERGQG